MNLRPSEIPRECAECGAPLRADQRYCLDCGGRAAPWRVDPLGALGFAAEAPAAPRAADAPASRRPSPRLSVALAAATLAIGGVVGAALGPGPEPSAAGAPPSRLVALVVPGSAPATTATAADDAQAPAAPEADGTSETPEASDDASADAGAAEDSSAAGDDSAGESADDGSSDGADDDASSPTAAPAPASTGAPASTTTPAVTVPAHVWLVALPATDPGAFSPGGPYADLAAQGALLSGYAAAGPSATTDAVALLGGQVPAADCSADPAPCVLPAGETSLPDQLTSIGLTWKAYVEDPALRCAPAPSARVATSLFTTLRERQDCAQTTAGLDALGADLADADATPALSLVVPTDPLTSLHALVAEITASKAYKQDGVLALVPDVPPPGALVLSPRATAGTTVATPTGPVALLRSLDGLFGLDPLAGAAQAPAGALDGVLTTSTPSTTTPSTTSTTRRSN